jgi:type II secretory ATPase GspE/PulE/Tfp pilus assembly ATPase PilB-like protein
MSRALKHRHKVPSNDDGSGAFLDYLVAEGVLEFGQLQALRLEHQTSGRAYETLCVEMGFMSAHVLRKLLAHFRGVEEVNLSHVVVDPEGLRSVPQSFCEKACCLPIAVTQSTVSVAMADVDDVETQDRLRSFFPGKELQILLAVREEIKHAIAQHRVNESGFEDLLEELELYQKDKGERRGDAENPITVRFIHAIILHGVKEGVSDIHFEPEQRFVRVRYRKDGVLKTLLIFHKSYWPALASRLKVISGIDIAEYRRPQSGRFSYYIMGREVDFRTATHPTVEGENIVIRILDKSSFVPNLSRLGYAKRTSDLLEKALQRPEGLIIMTGPTGSGKTTTLYSLVQLLSKEHVNVMTLEDPVEYRFPLIRQTEIQEKLEFGFSEGIKSILRQDPDVLLVGEIRDAQTAKMALRASMTGRQVLTSMHTPDAFSTIERFEEFGISQKQIANYLNCIVAQRLVRLLCIRCRKPAEHPFLKGQVICRAQGCDACGQTGYQGRTAVAEVLFVDENIRDRLLAGESIAKIRSDLKKREEVTLLDSARTKLIAGETSLEEILRVFGDVKI